MQYRELKGSDIRVSTIGFGVWTVGTPMWGITEPADGRRLLGEAFEQGITFYDTADVYGDGLGETLVAEALGAHRDEIVIATKFGYDFYKHPGVQPGQRERPQNWSSEYVREACERSLRRLHTDHIDLYQLHNPRLNALRADDLWAELERLRGEGKVRAIGAALGPALKPDRQCEEGVATVTERRAAVQIIYNLLEQVLGEAIFPAARASSQSVFVRVPHSSGLLEEAYDEGTTFAVGDHRQHRVPTDEARRLWLIDGLKKVEQLAFLKRDDQRTLGQAALQFVLAEPCVASVLPNIYNSAQLAEFAAATDTPALDDELGRIAQLYRSGFGLETALAGV